MFIKNIIGQLVQQRQVVNVTQDKPTRGDHGLPQQEPGLVASGQHVVVAPATSEALESVKYPGKLKLRVQNPSDTVQEVNLLDVCHHLCNFDPEKYQPWDKNENINVIWKTTNWDSILKVFQNSSFIISSINYNLLSSSAAYAQSQRPITLHRYHLTDNGYVRPVELADPSIYRKVESNEPDNFVIPVNTRVTNQDLIRIELEPQSDIDLCINFVRWVGVDA